MAAQRILIIQGHPDPSASHLCHALGESYRTGAQAAGREVRTVAVAALDFALLRSKAEWEADALPAGLANAQRDIAWADHVVLIFPLWLGDMPALLKGFLEQVARPGFAVGKPAGSFSVKPLLGGRSARVVVTMGMPSLVYRWYFGAHSVRSLERNILRFVGFAPVRRSLVGLVEGIGDARRTRWLSAFSRLGRRGA
jgi:putative NADPH-quinone reductase